MSASAGAVRSGVPERGALIVTRCDGESIEIEGGITVTVFDFKGQSCRVRIEAPKSTHIMRSELLAWRRLK